MHSAFVFSIGIFKRHSISFVLVSRKRDLLAENIEEQQQNNLG